MAKEKEIKEIIDKREDLSRFVVHLTRDDRKDNHGATARENFEEILAERKIQAFNPHCIFNKWLDDLPRRIKGQFRVACFTEIPLHQLHLLIQPIKGRAIKLEPYGFVFYKEFVISKGAQPAIYINSYDRNLQLRNAVNELFELAKVRGFKDNFHKLFPFLNAMHEKYDFTWEREWRIVKELKFSFKDLVCVILPRDKEKGLRLKFARYGIPMIFPGLTYEEIIGILAVQQRVTKKYWRRRKGSLSRAKKKV